MLARPRRALHSPIGYAAPILQMSLFDHLLAMNRIEGSPWRASSRSTTLDSAMSSGCNWKSTLVTRLELRMPQMLVKDLIQP